MEEWLLDDISRWGLSKGKNIPCLMVKDKADSLRIFSMNNVKIAEQLITDYVAARMGAA
jgi:hypothetical protein